MLHQSRCTKVGPAPKSVSERRHACAQAALGSGDGGSAAQQTPRHRGPRRQGPRCRCTSASKAHSHTRPGTPSARQPEPHTTSWMFGKSEFEIRVCWNLSRMSMRFNLSRALSMLTFSIRACRLEVPRGSTSRSAARGGTTQELARDGAHAEGAAGERRSSRGRASPATRSRALDARARSGAGTGGSGANRGWMVLHGALHRSTRRRRWRRWRRRRRLRLSSGQLEQERAGQESGRGSGRGRGKRMREDEEEGESAPPPAPAPRSQPEVQHTHTRTHARTHARTQRACVAQLATMVVWWWWRRRRWRR